MYAQAGKILYVDLGKGKVSRKDLPGDLTSKFLGGRGINAHLLWSLIDRPKIDALSPDNVLIFGTGVLTGTNAPTNARTTVTCKGAETNLYLKTSMGGQWGAELKFAGYDHLVLQGAAKKPSYLWIDDQNVELRDAKEIWGKTVREADRTLKKQLGEEVRIACIGPAGENLVRFASVMCSVYHAAARGGAGAVMGSKRLKAIAVRGSGEIRVKDPKEFHKITLELLESMTNESKCKLYKEFGTTAGMEVGNALYISPAYNYKVGHVENVWPLTGQCLVKEGWLKRRSGCFGCTIGCIRFTTVDSGPYAGAFSGGPQWESAGAFGSRVGVFRTDAMLKANELSNLMGLDASSTGSTIAWAMESFERGILTEEDTEGIRLHFGNAEAVIQLISMIARREGKMGNLLAEGVARAAKKVGKDSWKWAMCNSKGLSMSDVDNRCAKSYALAFAVNPRGPDHLLSNTTAELGMTPESIELIEKITGDKKWASPYFTEYRPEIVRWHEECVALTDSLGICNFTVVSGYAIKPEDFSRLYLAATGVEKTEKELRFIGRRIFTLERCFNAREGADRRMDDLPWRIMNEPCPEGPVKGMITTKEELDGMLDKYFKLHNWDLKTGLPTKKTLEMLDLKEVADQLGRIGKLPKKEPIATTG